MNDIIALDLETTGLNPRKDRIHGIGLADSANTWYCLYPSDIDLVRKTLEDPETQIVGHNIRFDLKFLILQGWEINCQWWDTKCLAQLINENTELGLKALTKVYLGKDALMNKTALDRAVSRAGLRHVGELCREDLNHPTHPYRKIIGDYGKEDSRNTYDLWQKLVEKAKKTRIQMEEFGYKKTIVDYYFEETMPTEKVLLQMELRGLAIDMDELVKYRTKLKQENSGYVNTMTELAIEEIAKVEEKLYHQAKNKRKSDKGKEKVKRESTKYKTKFNWQSSDHLSELLYHQLKLPTTIIEKTGTGKPSTSESAISTLSRLMEDRSREKIILETYAKWKKNLKLLTTYTGEKKGLLAQVENGRVYAEYLQSGRGKEGTKGGTVTGRLSSRNPNMQNLPRDSEIKKFFIPDPGHVFIYFDYSQLELRLAAHLSQDANLLRAYREGLDLHQLTADQIGLPRQIGKTTNFAMIYDASPWRLAQILSKDVTQCEHIIGSFFDLYKGYKSYLYEQKRFMKKYGLVVSETGRVRRLPDILHYSWNDREFKHAVKQGYNFPIQSLGASITKRCMIELSKHGWDIVTQVHDSVVIQVPYNSKADLNRDCNVIQQIAESIYPISVPLKIDMKVLTSLSESDIVTEGGKL